MAKGPGLYSDIGKKAKDLLYRDYQSDHKFSLTTYTANGVGITTSGIKKGETLLSDVTAQLKNRNITADVKVDTNSNVSATFTVDEPTPGLKTIFSFMLPDQKSGKAEVQYLHEYAGISTSLGFTANPVINFSGVAGNNVFALGTDLSYDTATGNFTKYNGGVSITTSDLIASLNVNDKGDTVAASYYHTVSPLTNTAVGAELVHCFSTKENTTKNDKGDTVAASYYHTVSPLTNTAVGAELVHCFSTKENTLHIGTQHALDPLTMVKARVNNNGKATALIQHQFRPKSLFTISGEVDTRAIEKSAKVGLALAFKP